MCSNFSPLPLDFHLVLFFLDLEVLGDQVLLVSGSFAIKHEPHCAVAAPLADPAFGPGCCSRTHCRRGFGVLSFVSSVFGVFGAVGRSDPVCRGFLPDPLGVSRELVGGCLLVEIDAYFDELFEGMFESDDGGGAVVRIEVEKVK